MPCIVCGNSQTPGLAAWHATCPSCAYESAALRVAVEEQIAADPVDEARREFALKALRQQNFQAIVEVAERFAPFNGRKLLDVGSAHGWFLEAARRRFDVLGIEPDAGIGAGAAARGLPVRMGGFPDVLQQGERFDVIVFNDVIEHISDIHGTLTVCRDRLTLGGILILNLPNSEGLFYRLSKLVARMGWRAPFDRLWQKDMPAPHVHYFNRFNLAALVGKHQFEFVYCDELPALRARGLLERLRWARDVPILSLYLQYLAVLCAIPVMRAFQSDIIVSVFRKRTQAA